MYNDVNAGNVSIGVATTGGFLTAVTNNATLISLSLTAAGITIGLIFHVVALIDRRRQMKQESQNLKNELKAEILKEMRSDKKPAAS